MARNVQKLAELLGAKVVGSVPDVGGGAFGAARLARIVGALQARLEPGQGRRAGRPTDASWVCHPKVPMSEATERKLARLAERASTPERKVSPMQMAAQLLEEVVAQISDES
jgi:hypothetical protein